MVSGRAGMWFGEGLGEHVWMGPGDFLYIPANTPHLAYNASDTEPCVGVVASTDPNEQEGGVRRIRDRSDGRTWTLANLAPDGRTPEDYAIVSRLFESGTGQLLITAAGITQYGTRAAGEFLTSRALLAQAAAKAPADWPRRNLQVLLRTAVHRGSPSAPEIVAVHAW